MKKDFFEKPDVLKEDWPGAFTGIEGAWFDTIANMPSPLAVVSGWKSNGKENACLQGGISFSGTTGELVCVLGWVKIEGHMYQSLKETDCCVVNFFSSDLKDKCFETIKNNDFDTDEITTSGLTAESALKINAPRIKECFLNVECEYLWEHELLPGKSPVAVVALRVINVSLDSDYFNPSKRFGKNGFFFFHYGGANPESGEKITFENECLP